MAYSPLYIHSFPLLLPHNITEAELFNITYTNPSQLASTADRLRYYRYKKALLQSEVSAYAEIDSGTYGSYEEGNRDYYPLDKLSKIAELLGVQMEDLLDDYNAFLSKGQSQLVKLLRQELGMTRSEFATHFSVHLWNVKQWERNKVRMSKMTWKNLFESRQKSS